MKQIKSFKRLTVLLLLFAAILTLTACGGGDKVPLGSISDDVYLTIGDVTVTEKQLYDKLRLQGAPLLATMIDEKVFADQVVTVKQLLANNDEDLNTTLDEMINEAIHGTFDEDHLEEMYEDYLDRWVRNIEMFADSLYLLDNSINIDQVILDIKGLSDNNDNAFSGYSDIDLLVERYSLRLAQRHFANELLAAEVIDSENDLYISDEDILSYYQSNKRDRYDVDALVVRFINLNEANAALQLMSIKSDARGSWYLVPDIRILPGEEGFIDLTDVTPQTGNAHVKEILEDLDLLSKLGVDYLDRAQLSVTDFANFYKSYTIRTDRDDGLPDEALTTTQVKEKFVAIYNVLNPAAQIEITNDGSIVGIGGNEFDPTLTHDDLLELDPGLRNHLYTTLISLAAMDDPDNLDDGSPFSSRVQTFGQSRFLVFKLADQSALEENIYLEDDEAFADTAEAREMKDEIFESIKESRLTATYITSKVSEVLEEKELNIFDSIVRVFFEQSFGYEGTDKNKSGDIIAEVGDIQITVDDFFTRLEQSFGINLALDIATNKLLLAQGNYVIDDADMEDFQTQFEDIISQFSGDNFAASGFPASMGRQQFLLLAFGAATNSEAINQLFVYPNLRQQFLDDFDAHYDSASKSIYARFAELAALQHDNFLSINASHLLIYFDEDGNGMPDDPQEHLDSLSPAGREQVLTGLTELVELVYSKVGDYTSMAAGLTEIANQFNSSGRIDRGSVIPPYDYQIELIWSQYRRLGFNLKFETLPSAITNSSNFITGSTVLDEVFYDRAVQLHAEISAMQEDDSKFPHLDLFGTVITKDALDEVMSSFGFHLILATSISEPASAMFDASDDTDERYTTDEGLNAYNSDTDTISASQVEFYLTEKASAEGVILPSELQDAITAFLTPILVRYQNNFMQRELIFELMEDVVFADSANNARFDAIREINRRQLNEYLLSPAGIFDPNYENLYGTWFNILEG